MSTDELSNEMAAELIKAGNREYIPYLWEQVNKLLYSLAYKYYSKYYNRFICCGVTDEDLKQECFFVMLDMVNAYDPEKGYKFLTYADYQFKCRLRRLLRYGDSYAENPLNVCKSFSDVVSGIEDEDVTIEDTIKDNAAELDFYNSDELDYITRLHDALDAEINAVLSDIEKRVLYQRYFKNNTYRTIGQVEHISAFAAVEREKRALKKLKRHNYVTKRLDSFKNDIISTQAYKNTGLNSFKNNQASSVESAIETANRLLENELNELAYYSRLW